MRTTLLLSSFLCLLVCGGASRAQDTYPLACNQPCIPAYEYVNTMSMSSNNKEYYTVFIVVFQNKGNLRLPINDQYEIVTAKGETHKPGVHPLIKRDVEARRKFSAETGKIKFINPGETKYTTAIFERISDSTPAFQFRIHGLPDLQGQPNKLQVVVDYEHLKDTIEKTPAVAAKDPGLVWESDPIPYNQTRMTARWRMSKTQRANEQ